VDEIILNLLENLSFIFRRLTWLSVVTGACDGHLFIVLLLRGTQAIVLLRRLTAGGPGEVNGLDELPAFSWLTEPHYRH
jgi:hypothetical protein